jgi:hypothetical protein
MKMIIRAVKSRESYHDYLASQLPDAEWCFDETKNAMYTFLRALRLAGNEPALHIEDDTLLSANFIETVTKVINQYPDNVIQFFSMRKADLEIGSRWDGNFMMGQCFYLPAGYSKKLFDFWPDWKGKEKHPTGLDTMVSDWLKTRREKYWLQVPSLVNHRECISVINPSRSKKRQSLTFKHE